VEPADISRITIEGRDAVGAVICRLLAPPIPTQQPVAAIKIFPIPARQPTPAMHRAADEVLVDEWTCDGIHYLDLQSNMHGGITFACIPMPVEKPEWLAFGVAIRIPQDPHTGRGACEARRRLEKVIAMEDPAMAIAPLCEPVHLEYAIPSAIIRLLRHWRTGHRPTIEDGVDVDNLIILPLWLTSDLIRWFEQAVPRRPLPRPKAAPAPATEDVAPKAAPATEGGTP
jgi:hypothetical protein